MDICMMSERCLNDVRCHFDVVFILGCHVGTFFSCFIVQIISECCLNDVWMMFGWCLKWCLNYVWMMSCCRFAVVVNFVLSKWYLNDVWTMSERCLAVLLILFSFFGCLNDICMMSEWYLNDIWMMSARYLHDVLLSFWCCLLCFVV